MNAMTQAAPEVFCDCGAPAEYVTGAVMYPHRRDLHHKSFYRSVPCDARVGCHPGTKAPLGRLATRRVRVARQRAHAAFDPLWKQGRMTRGDVAMTDLKRCPFCGCIASIRWRREYVEVGKVRYGPAVSIFCSRCPAEMSLPFENGSGKSVEELKASLVERWNTRADENNDTRGT